MPEDALVSCGKFYNLLFGLSIISTGGNIEKTLVICFICFLPLLQTLTSSGIRSTI